MHAYLESTVNNKINTVLAEYNSFQGCFEQSITKYESGFNQISRRDCGGWDEDCAGIYWRDGDEFQINAVADSGAWEWN